LPVVGRWCRAYVNPALPFAAPRRPAEGSGTIGSGVAQHLLIIVKLHVEHPPEKDLEGDTHLPVGQRDRIDEPLQPVGAEPGGLVQAGAIIVPEDEPPDKGFVGVDRTVFAQIRGQATGRTASVER
jgi:hypothetical protein